MLSAGLIVPSLSRVSEVLLLVCISWLIVGFIVKDRNLRMLCLELLVGGCLLHSLIRRDVNWLDCTVVLSRVSSARYCLCVSWLVVGFVAEDRNSMMLCLE